jgi:glyoxylase-like metal-dependent hydrolase (beta-lactamase superfamily II)
MQQTPSNQPRRSEEPLPQAREVASSIWKLTVAIPFPLRHVNMYALVGKEGWALVDTGMGTPEARAAFTAGLERAALNLEELRAIVLTHHHPDHVGLSGELYEKYRVPVYMHPIDIAAVQVLWSGTISKRFEGVSDFFLQHGLPPTHLWYTQVDPEVMRQIISVPPEEAFLAVDDGDTLDLLGERYRVIWVPGHADGQITLFRERDGVFLAADHVLPRITPNIGLYSTKERPNPLQDYLDSLEKVAHLPASIVLPGHGEPLQDLAGRCAEIAAHHEERETQLLTLLQDRPQHAAALAEQLFKQRLHTDEARRMGVAEVISHLEHMRYQGRITQHRTENGVILYTVG